MAEKHTDGTNKPATLRNLKIARVALVDMGANFDKRTGDGAHIVLWKRHEKSSGPSVGAVHSDSAGSIGGGSIARWDKLLPEPKPKPKRITPDHPDYDQYETDYEKGNLDAESRRALSDSSFAAVWTDSKGRKHRKLPIHDSGHLAAARGRLSAARIPSDVKSRARTRIDAATRRTQKEKRMNVDILKRMLGLMKEDDPAKRATGLAEVETLITKAKDDDDTPPFMHKADDAMCKCDDCATKRAAMPAAFGKRMDAIEKANTDLLAKLAVSEGRVAAAENIAKSVMAKAEKAEMRTLLKSFAAVPFKTDDDTEIDAFIVMKSANPAAFDAMIAKYKAVDAQLAKSALFADTGSARDFSGEGSAWAQIEAKADAAMAKGANGQTREQIIEKVLLDPANNDLVRQYRDEQ